MLYMRFIICLAVGLMGLSLLLKTVIDVLFTDWDLFGEVEKWWDEKNRRERTRYVLLEGNGRATRVAPRAAAVLPKKKRSEEFLAPPELIDPHVDLAPPPTLLGNR